MLTVVKQVSAVCLPENQLSIARLSPLMYELLQRKMFAAVFDFIQNRKAFSFTIGVRDLKGGFDARQSTASNPAYR
jgi:hypothetical protein